MAAIWPPPSPLKSAGELALREFTIDDGNTIVALFPGKLGENPELDSLVKYRQRGKRLRAPRHLHWAIDLLLKRQHKPGLTRKFINHLIEIYDRVQPYKAAQERETRRIKSPSGEVLETYAPLNGYGEYSVEFTLYIVELMAAVEKTLNPDAFMFKRVLELCAKPDSELDIYSVISTAGLRRK